MPYANPLPFERPIAQLEQQLHDLETQSEPSPATREAVRNMQVELVKLKRETFAKLTPWQIVQVSRHQSRPQTADYVELVFDDFIELHGDKSFGDDRAMLTGFAKLDDMKVMLIGQQKGRNLDERKACYYGCPHPEGYRKALAKMQMAEKFGLPIVCLIDTPGAYPGIGAEERGQAFQIAYNLREMSRIDTPIVCVVIGEGGSGGALGIGIGDHVSVLEFAYYSVISPEGCAGILWKGAEHAEKAANALRFTSTDLNELGIVDSVVPEPLGGAHRDHRAMAATLKGHLTDTLRSLVNQPKENLLDTRYERFRKLGVFEEATA